MGAGASVQRGPPGLDGKDGQPGKDGLPGKDGKDAIVDYIQLVSKTVADDSFKAQIKALLNDNAFKTIVTDFMNANVGTFKGPKGETEFKNLTAEEQSQIISKLINDNMTTFAVQLMANNSFKDAIVKMLESNPTNFRGPQGVQGPQGVGIKDANYDSVTGNLMFTKTDNSTMGSFMVRGADGRPGAPGPPGPAGNIQNAENVAWLQGKTMWCADGSCVVPNNNTIKNKLIRLGTFPDDQPGMTAQGEGLFMKSRVEANTPSTLIKIGDSNYPESGNPEMVFTGFAGGNAYSSAIRSGKGADLQFITNGEVRATMNGDGVNVKGNLRLGQGNTKNEWVLHTPDDDRKSLFIAPLNKQTGNWEWGKQIQIQSTGDVDINGSFSHVPTGTILMYSGKTEPKGFKFCDGSLLGRTDFPALFAVIGTTFGALNGSTFNLPDLRGRSPLGVGQGANLTNRTLGQSGAAETHTLSVNEMPSHSHLQTLPQGDQNYRGGGGNTLWGGNFSGNLGQYTANAGGSQAHNNMHPFLTINFIIKT
jgi:microcystin-dependent protein